jgi:Transposase DDE domain
MRITRFLRNTAVTIEEMIATACARTADRAAGHHVLAIQDTTDVRVASDNSGVVLHPTIATEATSGTLLGLVHAQLLGRTGGGRRDYKQRPFADKQSRRWLTAAERAAALLEAGAVAVTVVADRECDIYEEFALRPAGVDLVIRAGQDRTLADGSLLFARAETLPEAGRMTVDLPAAPGRSARTALLALRFCPVEIACPQRRRAGSMLPPTVRLRLIEAVEVEPPQGAAPAHWRLLTTHPVTDLDEARRIIGYYRQRWTIEQLFRTLKTKGFDIEALRIAEGGPFEKLVVATLVAAVTVLQLVRERDGIAKRPLADAFDPDDLPVLEALSANLEGKTERQKNPHPNGSLAFAAWVFARLGGWTGYYGKPGPIVILNGLLRFHTVKHGWRLHNV